MGGRHGHGSDGLHGLHRHGEPEEEAGGDVVEGGEVEVVEHDEGQRDGDVRPEVSDGVRELCPKEAFELYGVREAAPAEVGSGGGVAGD